uniref:Uncharacterized protein n=1 Tax=Ananas comosus var. bracteatus TaxID=296719 RepID=A0A6V7QPP7_ANACO|nr:unnamed protein product [Ananas comosus var. bracteatus]
MAANSKGRAIAGSFGKRFVNQIWASRNPSLIAVSAASDSRRAVYSSSYDKNVEEDLVHPVVVPDHVIETCESEKYWGPHPTTGVFGPAATATATAGTKDGPGNAAAVAAGMVAGRRCWTRRCGSAPRGRRQASPPTGPQLNPWALGPTLPPTS